MTESQAAAVQGVAAGRPIPGGDDRWRTRQLTVLFDRGLVRANGRGLELTDLGQAAAALALFCSQRDGPQIPEIIGRAILEAEAMMRADSQCSKETP